MGAAQGSGAGLSPLADVGAGDYRLPVMGMTGRTRWLALLALATSVWLAVPALAQPQPQVPTLTFWGKVILVAALIGAGLFVMRRSPPAE